MIMTHFHVALPKVPFWSNSGPGDCARPELVPAWQLRGTGLVSPDDGRGSAFTDVVMLLRDTSGQQRRLTSGRYQMTTARLKIAKRDAIVMHPGPIIRGMELTDDVADGAQSRIIEEVHNGVPTRMAILARAMGRMR
jgi:aspartate carbamoyltransferase catalytic subunit